MTKKELINALKPVSNGTQLIVTCSGLLGLTISLQQYNISVQINDADAHISFQAKPLQ